MKSGGYLIAFKHDGSLEWLAAGATGGIPAIANLDGDGEAEIVTAGVILNHLGTVEHVFPEYGSPAPIIANLDMQGDPEIILGYVAYHADGSLYWRHEGLANHPFAWTKDIFAAVANLDADSYPEVILVSRYSNSLYILEHDGTEKYPAVPVDWGGGAPAVANMDEDPLPEIAIGGRYRLMVFEPDGTAKWWQPSQDNSSWGMGAAAFDFDGDGQAEVVYGDEVNLWMFRGSNGDILWSTPSTSATNYEMPLVADVDADGNAEIIKVSNPWYGSTTGIQVYGDPQDTWQPARQTWNQHSYHTTNVNEDGSIPTLEGNSWELYNTYRASIYTQGCATARPDLTASYVRKAISGSDITLTARIGNGGQIFVNAGVSVSFYDGDPQGSGTLLGTTTTTARLNPGQYQDVAIVVPVGTQAQPVWVVADDPAHHTELDENNNFHASSTYLTHPLNEAPAVDAGEDQQVTIPEQTVTLSGTVNDDGLPIEVLFHHWSQVSGPGTATFADLSALTTTVDFSQGGVYVLRLTASDGEFTAADEVTVTVTSTLPPPVPEELIPDIPGFIAAPENTGAVCKTVPVVLDPDLTTLRHITVDYWPVNYPERVTVLAADLALANGGDTVATLDTTVLANDSYAIRVMGLNDLNEWVASAVMVTVACENKPGRVRFSVTDMVVPVSGLPIAIGRTYDSLERAYSGDFGYGWTLDIANPRLEVDPAHNVTLTLPNGKRATFYFTPYTPVVWLPLMIPHYTPEPGVYGQLEGSACPLAISGGTYFCFPGQEYDPSRYTYTDPYGRVFTLSREGTLESIRDLNGNTLTFTPDGITSSSGELHVPFFRDAAGRITRIISPEGDIYEYDYDAAGDLVEVRLPDPDETAPLEPLHIYYEYYTGHLFQSETDPRGSRTILTSYYEDGRLHQTQVAPDDPHLNYVTTYVYDVPGNTTTITHPHGGEVRLTYNEAGYLTQREVERVIDDPAPLVTTYAYDAQFNVTAVTNPAGETTHYTYDEGGHRTSVKNAEGETVISAAYNRYGGPTELRNGIGKVTTIDYYDTTFMPMRADDDEGRLGRYAWDSHGNLEAQWDGNGFPVLFEYDAYGNITQQADREDRITQYEYDLMGRRTSSAIVVDINTEYTTTYNYDALGRIIEITDPLGHTTFYEYDANGNRTRVIDRLGNETVYEYDALNRLIKTIFDDGTFIQKTYDFQGNVLMEIDQAGHKTRYEYDLAGQLIFVTEAFETPDAATTAYQYDNAGRQIEVTIGYESDAAFTSCYEYDEAGRTTKVIAACHTALASETLYFYDDAGQMIQMTDANGHSTYYEYDARGRLEKTIYHDGTFVSTSYDENGNVLTRTDQNGQVTRYAYNRTNQMTQVTLAYGSENPSQVQYEYDAVGNLALIRDNADHETRFTYDALQRQTYKYWPDNSYEQFTYDAEGNLTHHRLADSNINLFFYNNLNQLEEAQYFDGQIIEYTYTPTGQRYQVTEGTNPPTTYTYDYQDRPVLVTLPDGRFIGYAYDDADNRVSMSTPAGTTLYDYDDANRLHTVEDVNSSTITTYEHDLAGRLKFVYLPNGITTAYTYDSVDHLTRIEHRDTTNFVLASFEYLLDDAGYRQAVIEKDSSRIEWEYDAIYRLTDERRYGIDGLSLLQDTTFTYDAAGNRETMTVDGQTTTYHYNVLDQLIRIDDPDQITHTYHYDGRGNLQEVFDGTASTFYGYDARDRLTEAVLPTGSVYYDYDADGRRTRQTVGMTVTHYLWDAFSSYGDVVMESDGNDNLLAAYTLAEGQLIAQTRGNDTSYYLADGQHSIRALVDETGTLTDTYDYTAFGELYAQTGTTPNNYLYTGQQYDEVTGLYSLRARYYDPSDGRFLSRDSYSYNVKNPVELNRYAYAQANPITYADPSGLFFESAIGYLRSFANHAVVRQLGKAFFEGALAGLAGYLVGLAFIAYFKTVDSIIESMGKVHFISEFFAHLKADFNALDFVLSGIIGGALNVFYTFAPTPSQEGYFTRMMNSKIGGGWDTAGNPMFATLLAMLIADVVNGAVMLYGLIGAGSLAAGLQEYLSRIIQKHPRDMSALMAAFAFGTFNVLSVLGRFAPDKRALQIGVGTAINVVVNLLITGGEGYVF